MPSSPSSPNPNPRKWRYTWEALSHIPILRLYLFNPYTTPSLHCRSLSATLRPDRAQLLLRWDEADEVEVEVAVPVPRVLIDYDSEVGVVVRDDHVEVKLALVLPVDHPIVRAAWEVEEGGETGFGGADGLRLDSDQTSLSVGNVHFYCKACSAKLTRKSFSKFVELPSVDWKEVADNWFGSCCCSFGGISEKLVAEYVKTFACTEGTCLVDPASVIVFKDDIEGSMISESGNEAERTFFNNQTDNKCTTPTHLHKMSADEDCISPRGPQYLESLDMEISKLKLQVDNKLSLSSMSLTTKSSEETGQRSASCTVGIGNSLDEKADTDFCKDVTPNLYCEASKVPSSCLTPELSSEKFHHCCTSKTNDRLGSSTCRQGAMPGIASHHQTNQNLSHNGSLGGGFLIKTSNLPNNVKWAEYVCKECSSLLGAFPSLDADIPADGGIRLFKSSISSSQHICGAHDIFRKHSLEKVFINILLESAADELSFRTIVRDVKTKSPKLKLIIMNSKVWGCSGYCYENGATGHDFSPDLKPYAKVLYSNCCTATDNSRSLAEWGTKNHADEMYMLSSLIEQLTENLKLSQEILPRSCSLMQGMSLSFIER